MSKDKIIYKNAQDIKLRNWLKSTHSERFHKLMRLWKINKMLKGAKIKHVD
jgi:hypothetical protein